jgi:hypothetical protein
VSWLGRACAASAGSPPVAAAVAGLALVPLGIGVIRELTRRHPDVALIALLAMTVALCLGRRSPARLSR